jgi:non-ribosomal peptide synthetase component E (peptide arylation enzyme)
VSVIGIPDPVYGERVCACVVLRPATSLTLDELNDFLRGRQIAVFKLPERMESFEELPKSAGGKITKVALRGMVAQHLSTSST